MSTKLPEPKSKKFSNYRGWIFPDYSGKENRIDIFERERWLNEKLAPINSFEYQQGIFGQYRHFYSLKINNNYLRNCYKLCINQDTLETSNLSQQDKLCARECILTAEKYRSATNIFIETSLKEQSIFATNEHSAF